VPQDKKDLSIITDTQRLDAALPTIEQCLDKVCRLAVLFYHLGRPDGSVIEKSSMAPEKGRKKPCRANWTSR
jgi:phosphoglycerate kinase